MELRTVNTFLHIAELHSFSRTARQLGYSQSAVSSQIAQLEAELGTPLFDRVGKTVRLTDAGQTFLGYARTLLETAQQAQAALQPAQQVRGSLRWCWRQTYRSRCASLRRRSIRWRRKAPSRWIFCPGRSFCSPSGA